MRGARCAECLVRVAGLGPFGEFRHDVEFAEELADDFAGVLPLTELLELAHDARERVLSARDRALGVVLALAFEALMMSEEFFPEELRATLAHRAVERLRTCHADVRQTAFRGHSQGRVSV